jgi:hypothetical protein
MQTRISFASGLLNVAVKQIQQSMDFRNGQGCAACFRFFGSLFNFSGFPSVVD